MVEVTGANEIFNGQGLREVAEDLCTAAHWCSARGWVPATAGNFSFRTSEAEGSRIFITASGLDKGSITRSDLIEVDFPEPDGFACRVLAGSGKPSAETCLHGVIYRRFPEACAIVHVHTVWNTLLSDRFANIQTEPDGNWGAVSLENYELLKALSGVSTHQHRELVPILENSQDYVALAAELDSALRAFPLAHGVLLCRHGLYTWGESVAGARRHLEALEFLFEVEGRRLLGAHHGIAP